MSTKTDLAKEIIDKISPEFNAKSSFYCGKTKITKIEIKTESDSKLIEKPMGKYLTVEADSIRHPEADFDEEVFAIKNEISSLLPKEGDILLVALGNRFLTADSLGTEAASKSLAGSFFGRSLRVLFAEAEGKTALSPRRLIKAAVLEFNPAAVILIDSLAAEDIGHICRSIQITDAGIIPGSGIRREKSAINKEYLGIPVLAIGTPTVIRFPEKENIMVSPNDIDVLIKRAAHLIAVAVSFAVFKELDIGFIKDLIR